MFKKILSIALVILLLAGIVMAAKGFKYSPNVKPHTRFNPLRLGCYYYYGYGSCKVDNEQCKGVSIGRNKWIDLGDACNRNEPPKLAGMEDVSVTETEAVKITAKCIDEDPVSISYSGWTDKAETPTGYDDAGKYQVAIKCTDSFEETAEGTISIIIKDKNRAPLFKAFGYELNKE